MNEKTIETLPKPRQSPHYQGGPLEVIDALYNLLPREEFKGFCRGNIIKYVCRYKFKGGIVDLDKAGDYLGWLKDAERGK